MALLFSHDSYLFSSCKITNSTPVITIAPCSLSHGDEGSQYEIDSKRKKELKGEVPVQVSLRYLGGRFSSSSSSCLQL